MEKIQKELVEMLNQALRLEHAARIQYLAHAELIQGLNAETIIGRLKEIAADEEKHEAKFRDLIGSYLGGEPTMELGATHKAQDIEGILHVNLEGEKEAIDFYKQIHRMVIDSKQALPYAFERLEHEIRHVIMDEQEHVAELSLLLGS